MKRRDFIKMAGVAGGAFVLLRDMGAAEEKAKGGKPNIIVILADDLGYGDAQCYNPERGKIHTPNIDKLASQGMRFTDAHSSSGVCSPSRYALLTGRYHWRTKLQKGIVTRFGEPLISKDRLTIAGLAKQYGYRTGAIGKWHLGWDWPIPESQLSLFNPEKNKNSDDEAPVATDNQKSVWQDVFSKPIPGGPISRGFDSYFGTDVPNWPPFCFIENDKTVGIPSEFLPSAKLKDNLASWQGPALPDWPLEKILPALQDRACAYIVDATKKPEPFMLYMPLTSPHTPLSVTDEWKGKSGLNTYADFVMQTDAVIGRVMDAVEKSGAAGNTMIILTSDNGCAPYIGVTDLEAMGHFPSGPLKGYKFDVWEGGHRMPFIVRWPGVVKPGTVCGQLVHHADVMATIADILGAKLPDNAGEDSFSIRPLLEGQDKPVRQNAVSCSAQGVHGVRSGSWKLVFEADPDAQTDVHLFDLNNDIGEQKNLAATQPDKVAELKALHQKLITEGRSTPGIPQNNDVPVVFMGTGKAGKKK